MASPSMLPPPPGGAPTSPLGASPAPAAPNPQMRNASQTILGLVQGTRSLAQQFPEVAPLVSQINDLLRQVMMKVSANQPTGEAAAPPTG